MIRGQAYVDLRGVQPEKMPARLNVLASAPDGATVVVHVGHLAAEPGACRVLAGHQNRIDIVLWAEPWNVSRWLNLIRSPDVLPGVA